MRLKNRYSIYFLPALFSLVAILLYRVWRVNPDILLDEYTYSMQSKYLPFRDHEVPNYLYSLIMKSTLSCDTSFYQCAKAINAGALTLGIIVLYLISRRFLNPKLAFFGCLIATLTPTAFYLSFFLPEIIYFASLTLAIWGALKASDVRKIHWWLLTGLLLAFAALVKPHAIFILPAFIIFGALVSLNGEDRNWRKSIINSFAILLGFFIVKIGIGVALAGSKGVTLFGGYGNPINLFKEYFLEKTRENDAPITSALSVQIEPIKLNGSFENFFQIYLGHLVFHLGFLLLFAGIPLYFGAKALRQSTSKGSNLRFDEKYFLLILLISFFLLIAIPAFEYYVTLYGDNHSNRLLFRHYEFLIPHFVVMAFGLPSFENKNFKSRLILGALIIISGSLLIWHYIKNVNWSFSDSALFAGMAKTSTSIFFLIFLIMFIIDWIEKPKRGAISLGRVGIPIFMVGAFLLSQNTLIDKRGESNVLEIAGTSSRQLFKKIDGNEISVVSDSKQNAGAIMFWLDKPGVKQFLAIQGGSLINDFFEEDINYLIVLGDFPLAFEGWLLDQGPGYKIVKIDKS